MERSKHPWVLITYLHLVKCHPFLALPCWRHDFAAWIINDNWAIYLFGKMPCCFLSPFHHRQEALLAAISEKDANIALLELSSSKKKKTQDEVALLKREKDRLVQQLKQQVGRGLRMKTWWRCCSIQEALTKHLWWRFRGLFWRFQTSADQICTIHLFCHFCTHNSSFTDSKQNETDGRQLRGWPSEDSPRTHKS